MADLTFSGMRGSAVKADQILLNLTGAGLKADGIFGIKTKAAVLKFQAEHALYQDGVVGPVTRYELTFYKYPHFSKEEFKCHCGGKYCNGYPTTVKEGLLVLLEKIRTACGNKPITINRGISCTRYNATIAGAASDSQHIYGTAADITVSGVSDATLDKICLAQNPNGGVGTSYPRHTHVDARGIKARW